jgi:hypothetical protein
MKETDMVAVTYGVARVSAKAAEKAAPRASWFTRFVDALMESRMQQARREIARHAHLLPYSLDEYGNRLLKIEPTDMPFGGW